MGAFNVLGNLAGGLAAGRDARKANDKAEANNKLMRDVLLSKAKPADGIGGTPVTETGKGIKVPDVPVGGTDGMTAKPKSGLSKVGGAIGSGFKALLGFKEGGRITKSGVAFVHKGETVIPAKQSMERKTMRSSVRKSGRR